MTQTKHTILTKLAERGYTLSQQRLVIIDKLCDKCFIDDIDDFWISLRQHHAISWSTVHKTIRLLENIGCITKATMCKRQQRYLLTVLL